MHQQALYRIRALDRGDLVTLLGVINGASNSLRRDEGGDWAVIGSRGSIRACGGTFSVFVAGRSRRHWFFVKKALAGFCAVAQDGDDEGILRLNRLPIGEEAARLRAVIGLRQTRPSAAADHLRRPSRAVSHFPRPEGEIDAVHAPRSEGGCHTAPGAGEALNGPEGAEAAE
jgi:hypothetical protein